MKQLIASFLIIFLMNSQTQAQCSCQGNTVTVVYYYVPVQNSGPQTPPTTNTYATYNTPEYSQNVPTQVTNSDRWINTLNVVEQSINVVGQVISLYQNIRNPAPSTEGYYQSNQNVSPPPNNVVYQY